MEKNRTMQQNARRTLRPFIFVYAKMLLVFLFCGLSTAWSPLYAQDNQVTLHVKDMPLGDVVKELKKQTGKDFLFSNREVNADRKVTVNVSNKALKEVLPLVFGKDFRFEITENVVIVRPFVAVTSDGGRAGFVVKGVVLDRDKQPLTGVTVKVTGTSVGTATDDKGKFSLRLPITKGSLEFSFVGFVPQTVAFTENTKDTLRILLQEDVAGLDEVQVVAYGSQKKRTLVSSVSTLKADEMKELPTHSLESLLQGHMAGVEVNNLSGAPGGGGSIVAIRGYNSFFVDGEGGDRQYGTPLYVVDGVPMQAFTSPITGSNTLSDLDPSMIESIEVLKDAASAAIYGSRAGNGVILITTKKGRAGKAHFTANVSYSASWLPETPVQSGGQLARYYNLRALRNTITPYDRGDGMWVLPKSYADVFNYKKDRKFPVYNYFFGDPYSGKNAAPLQDSLNEFYNNSTDWWKYAFHTAKVYNANLQASGGTEKVRYMVGAGYYKEEGIMYGSDFERLNVISNLSVAPTKRLQLDNQISLTYSDRSRGGKGGEGQKVEGITVNPQENSSLLPGEDYIKKYLLSELNSNIEKNQSYSLRYNLVLNYEIIRNMRLSVSGSVDYNQQNQNFFRPSTADKDYHRSYTKGTISKDISILNENLLNYSFKMKEDHHFDILLGLSFQKDQTFKNLGDATGGPNDFVHYAAGEWGETNGLLNQNQNEDKETNPLYESAFGYSSSLEEERMNSYFGRLRYDFKEKYLVEATLRRDGSSVFGEKVRWATFPSVAVGWIFTEEPFMKPFYWFSFGKIRVSWGESGQKFRQRYLAHGLMGSTNETFLGKPGMGPESTGGVLNQKLSWEKTDQYDIGLDFSFLDYRFKMTCDYYYRYTKGQLQQIDLPGNMNYQNFQWQNALAVSNEGLEIELTADLFRETAVKWRMKLNASRNWNRFEKSSDGYDYGNNVIGKPLYNIKAYKTEGYFNTMEEVPYYSMGRLGSMPLKSQTGIFYPGTRRIVDLDNNGIISDSDMYFAASPLPVAHGGFINEIKWKQFDLNIFFTYSLGRHILKTYDDMALAPNANGNPITADIRHIHAWTGPDSKNPDYPNLIAHSNSEQFTGMYASDIETVHMLRLKQLTLGYNVHESAVKKMGLSSVRVFFTGENLFLLTNYSGLDPEIVNITSGLDNLRGYPLPRKFTVGLTINF